MRDVRRASRTESEKEEISMNIIVYGSKYGSAKKYAEELSRRTGYAILDYESVSDINAYEKIVFIGALYAGGIVGMKTTFGKLKDLDGKKIAVVSVGLADSTDNENIAHIRNSIKRQLSEEVFKVAQIFHLRGAIDYSRLSVKHRVMMALLYKKAKALPEEKKNAEIRAMIETYGKQVDFIDFETLSQIVCAMCREPARNVGTCMNNFIGYCGLDCESCEARLATVNNDNEARARVAKKWSELNGVEITAEMINCAGCRIDGVKTPYCESLCPIRQCAMGKKIETCGKCSEMESCEKIGAILKNNPDVRGRLKNG